MIVFPVAFISRELMRLSATRVWLVAFIYALLAGLSIQLVVLPVLLPSFHAGHGLLAGNDVSTFHNLAVELARRIEIEGWSAWTLKPDSQAPAGIMGAAYVFFPDEPWVVVPLYAAFFAISISLLFVILRLCGFGVWAAGMGVLPLLFLPSSSLLYAIPHKDVFFVCGNMLFFYSILRLAVTSEEVRYGKGLLCLYGKSFLVGLTGAFLVWTVRPYGVTIMMGAGGLAALAITIRFVIGMFQHRRRDQLFRRGSRLVVLWLLIFVLNPLGSGGFSYIVSSGGQQGAEMDMDSMPKNVMYMDQETGKVLQKVSEAGWVYSGVLPKPFEAMLQRMTDGRNEYLFWHQNAASAVDVSVSFLSARDMVAYLPRALQVGLFAPFPADWIGQGSLSANTLMRRISALEMIVWYLFFPFLLWALVRGPDRLAIGILAVYAVSTILVIAVSLPNIGTLYRIRFGFWIILFAVAVAMATTMLERRRPACAD